MEEVWKRRQILDEHAEKRSEVAPDWKRRITDKRKRCFRPEQAKKGKRPKFHAVTKEEWVSYVANWNAWRTRYHDASARLKRGIVSALFEFPRHCFLPTGLLPREVLEKPPP